MSYAENNPAQQPYSNQVNLTTKPYGAKTLREMIGSVLEWNPDLSSLLVTQWLNETYRDVLNKRLWYGLQVRGQVQVPDVYNRGSAAVTQGSASVVGAGTVWTEDMAGRQFRIGMTEPIGNVASVEDATHLTLDMPWGGYDHPTTGYRIFQSIVSFGPNIKYVKQIVNLRDAWILHCHVPQEAINTHDPRRSYVTRPMVLADYVPSASGVAQFELWPPPYVKQAFPYLAYIQPPEMTDDDHFPVAFIRGDVLVKKAIAEALVHPSARNAKRYDAVESQRKEKQYLIALNEMIANDENLAMTQLRWRYEDMPLAPLPWGGSAMYGGGAQDRL